MCAHLYREHEGNIVHLLAGPNSYGSNLVADHLGTFPPGRRGQKVVVVHWVVVLALYRVVADNNNGYPRKNQATGIYSDAL